jgi:Ser/Thr protein kinase RdoA (MazF antagonist)
MSHARAHGFPVPAAEAVSGTDIVMDRAVGPTMLSDMVRRPWLLPGHAATLAALLTRLHAIHAPGWLPSPLGAGQSLLHLDLHPENVILTASGPVVIDWSNAARGPGAVDAAHSWIVLACSLPPRGRVRRAASLAGRRLFVARFLRAFDRAALAAHLEAAGAYRLSRRLPAEELEAIARMVEREKGR